MPVETQFSLYWNVSVAVAVSPAAALELVWSCVTMYCVATGFTIVLVVGLAVAGLVSVENKTARPDPIEMAVVMSVVSAALAVVLGVAYVEVTVPLSVSPVPNVPAV